MGKTFGLENESYWNLASLASDFAQLGLPDPNSGQARFVAGLKDSAQGAIAANAAKKAARKAKNDNLVSSIISGGANLATAGLGLATGGLGNAAGGSLNTASQGVALGNNMANAASSYDPASGAFYNPSSAVVNSIPASTTASAPVASTASSLPAVAAEAAPVGANTVLAPTATADAAVDANLAQKILGVAAPAAAVAAGAGIARNRSQANDNANLSPSAKGLGIITTGVGPMSKSWSPSDLAADPKTGMEYAQEVARTNKQIPSNVWQTLPDSVRHSIRQQYPEAAPPTLGSRILGSINKVARAFTDPNGTIHYYE